MVWRGLLVCLHDSVLTWLTGTRYGGGGRTQEVVPNGLINVHTHFSHRAVVTPEKKHIYHQSIFFKTEINIFGSCCPLFCLRVFTYMALQGLPIFGGGPMSRPGARSPRSGPESSITGSTGFTITGPEVSGMMGLVSIGGWG